MSTLLADLFAGYRVEGLTMPIDREEFIRQAERRAVLRAPVEVRLEGIPPEQLVEKLLHEGKTHAMTPEVLEKLRQLIEKSPPA
jgi:hypothetical protein